MEEIQWFGQNKEKEARVFPYVQEVLNLVGNDVLKENNIIFPYTYVFTLEHAMKFSPVGVDWPVICRFCYDDSFGCKSVLANGPGQFVDLIELHQQEHPEALVLISLPICITPRQLCYHQISFFVARNYIAIHDGAHSRVAVFQMDISRFFQNLSLNPDLVYRLLTDGARYYVESLFAYNDPRLAPLTRNFRESFRQERDSFIQGYKNGFAAPLYLRFHNSYFQNCHFGGPDANTSGYLAGLTAKKNLVMHLKQSGYELGNVENLSKLIGLRLFASPTVVENLEELVSVHNSLMLNENLEKNPESIERALHSQLMTNVEEPGANLNGLLDLVRRIALETSLSRRVSGHENAQQILTMPADGEVEIHTRVTCDAAQIRILEEKPTFVTYRLQMSNVSGNVGLRNKETGDEHSSSTAFCKIEVQVDLLPEAIAQLGYSSASEFVVKFKSFEHSQKSMEGTGQLYVPVKLDADMSLQTMDGETVLPHEALLGVLKERKVLLVPFAPNESPEHSCDCECEECKSDDCSEDCEDCEDCECKDCIEF